MDTARRSLPTPALVVLAGVALLGLPLAAGLSLTPDLPGVLALSPLLRLDALSLPVLALTVVLGAVLLRFARTYLDGDPARPAFLAWFTGALASVSLLVVSNHLLLLIGARTASSLCVHRLLTTYPERPKAQLAAHKVFLANRAADLCLLGAAWLLWDHFGTLQLDALMAAHGAAGAVLDGGLQLATVLLAGAALLLCAQLPVHGWLTQVMEAPTPVSALLHAGVINVGGFLLIRCAPLMAGADLALGLLVVVGGLTAVLASLILLTRVSVKVGLAWSTCAQMGFMLLECGLGLWSLALLHLLAHSAYKARAFLRSGSVVAAQRVRDDGPAPRQPLPYHWVVSGWVTLAAGIALVQLTGGLPAPGPQGLALAAVLGAAVVPLLAEAQASGSPRAWLRVAGLALALVGLHLAWHRVLAAWLAPVAPDVAGPWWPAVLTAALFLGLLVVQAVLRSFPAGALSRRLYPYVYGGLFLDELSTRFTLWIWPRQLLRLQLRRPRLGARLPHRGVSPS